MAKKNIYTDDSIYSLNPREFTQLRPSTYLGSNENSNQLVREIFANSLDEHNIGHGDLIEVEVDTEKHKYSVKDNGQGFPIDVTREDGESVFQASFDVINTSGKYDDSEESVYEGSALGLNGIGCKLVTFLSKTLHATTYRDGKFEDIKFKNGLIDTRTVGDKDNPSGTIVQWVPDEKYFQNVDVNDSSLRKFFAEEAALCPELTIKYKYNDKDYTFHSANGLHDLLDTRVQNKELLSNRFAIKRKSGPYLFDVVLTYTTDYSDDITAYVNYGLTESGVHISAVKSEFTKQINKYAKQHNLFKKKEDTLSGAELSEGLTIVFNIKATNVKYDSQTKTRVVDIDKTLLSMVMSDDLQAWLENNSRDAELIIERALNARRARDAAQAAKDKIRNATTKSKKFLDLPTKLVDAYSKNRKECELYLTEGDSAAGGIISQRDGKTQAVMPLRGKILSCRKATIDKIYANPECASIIKALGLEVDKSTGVCIYDTKKLRYDRIIFNTDADPDGYQIRLLLITFIWRVCKELIINGHVYIAEPPLFKVTTTKNEYLYFKDQAALDKYKKSNAKNIKDINRLKGLGEMDPEELAENVLYPESRNIVQLTVNDVKESDDLLETFMGVDVPPRRDYLMKHYNEVEVDVE